MSAHMDEDDSVCFIFQEDEDAKHSTSQLKDVRVGESFIFRGERFTKVNNYGWVYGVCNIRNESGSVSHIHPTTTINLLH